MTPDSLIVIIILIASIVLFVTEKLRADVVALLVLFSLIATGVLSVDEAFSGFASPAVVTVWAVFIISGGLQRSGAADVLAQQLLRLAGNSETRLLLIIMLAAGIMSAFMNNIGAVAILMPSVIAVGRKLRISPSKLLMPLAFAALLGGNMTLIGTPPNILAASLMQDAGLTPFGFFDFLPTGILVLTAGVAYMMLAGRRLLPTRITPGDLTREYHVREFLTEVEILEDSPLIGKTLAEVKLRQAYELNVIYLRRGEEPLHTELHALRLAAGDILLLEGSSAKLLSGKKQLRLRSMVDFSAANWLTEFESEQRHVGEITLAPRSALSGLTLNEINFRDRYGLSVLAVRHNGVDQIEQLATRPIQDGDTLLVQGERARFDQLTNDNNLLVLESPAIELRRTEKITLAWLILLAVVVSAGFGLLPVAAIMLGGALLMVIGGVIHMEEAYRAIDWKAVFLIAGMLPLGLAMQTTGTAEFIAQQLVALTGGLGPTVILVMLFVITALLTEVISNAAATVLIVPLAIGIAQAIGVNPQPLIMASVIAASTSFLMPIGHQVNIIIYGAGGYRFSDYARVGVGLNLLLLLLTAVSVPLIWPF